MDTIKKIIFLASVAVFFATSWVMGWLPKFAEVISGAKAGFWDKMAFEFQVFIVGLLIVLFLLFISTVIRD